MRFPIRIFGTMANPGEWVPRGEYIGRIQAAFPLVQDHKRFEHVEYWPIALCCRWIAAHLMKETTAEELHEAAQTHQQICQLRGQDTRIRQGQDHQQLKADHSASSAGEVSQYDRSGTIGRL